LEFIGAHRTNSNRLGIAVQLCFLRHPGWAWTPEERIPATMLRWIAAQVSADPGDIESYAKRDPTRREHFLELLQEYCWHSFGLHEYREMSAWLMNQARSTDLGLALITLLISELRDRRIAVPVLPVLERLTIAARSRARRKAYRALNADLTFEQRLHLDRLLELRGESRQTWLGWLRQAIGAANPNNILACIERLTFIRQAVFFNRLGELRDRTYQNQQHRASGLNLVVAAIALWNTVYLERAISALQERSYAFDQKLLVHLSPLKWEHINLTGDYHWRRDGGLRNRKLRPLRSQPLPDFAS